jgi:hypothetical protein
MSATPDHDGGPELAPGTAEVLQAATRVADRTVIVEF